jgi:hypothetical protein
MVESNDPPYENGHISCLAGTAKYCCERDVKHDLVCKTVEINFMLPILTCFRKRYAIFPKGNVFT